SGLKTAVRLQLENETSTADRHLRANVAASFQAAVVDTLVEKSLRALEHSGLTRLVVSGGVGANMRLRDQLRIAAERKGYRVYYPRPAYCTDNGAMIAYAGWCRRGTIDAGTPEIQARPRWPLDELTPVTDAG
ncbi:MAG TPA: carbamoyltransferase N-terminal domain-containing protein, partial [Gammaproteobacteria bacterium]